MDKLNHSGIIFRQALLPPFLLEGGGSGWPKEAPGNSAIALTRMVVRYEISAS